MPSYTSVRSGYWSDPETWSPNGVPKEGDTVTIEAGHTVILDLDLSGFPNGLAGLTINGTLLIPSLNDPSYSEVGEETSGSPWLEGWSYRRTVFVDNSFSSTTLTDFQIIIRVNTAYLIQQGKMREDCGDIRVTDADGNLLPIWIDPDTKNMWNTKVYVKVPSIPANGTVTLYLFYGNPSATDVSDASAVFDFFDDFSGTTLDETKWTAASWYGSGTWSVAVNDGYVEISTGSGTRAGIVSNVAFPLPFIVEGKYVYVSGDHVWNSITQTTGGSHIDLVEHGYDSSGTYYTYRKASGGSYSNYQRFARYAPRGSIFTRFAIEWLTNASRYYEWDIQINSTTTQDRYTSGSCYLQLSTYNNGISRWDWIAVRKHAATPPAVYFRTLSYTALKVNANIAGSGTLQVGSSDYPITEPQHVIIALNGSITTAYCAFYGTSRSWLDYLADAANAGSTQLSLRGGLPLRRGDLLVVARSSVYPASPQVTITVDGGPYLFLVSDYDEVTKAVTINPPLSENRSLVIAPDGVTPILPVALMSRPIRLVKFGSAQVNLTSGSGYYISGTMVYREMNSSGGGVFGLNGDYFVDSSSMSVTGANKGGPGRVVNFLRSVFFNAPLIPNTGNMIAEDCFFINTTPYMSAEYNVSIPPKFVGCVLANSNGGFLQNTTNYGRAWKQTSMILVENCKVFFALLARGLLPCVVFRQIFGAYVRGIDAVIGEWEFGLVLDNVTLYFDENLYCSIKGSFSAIMKDVFVMQRYEGVSVFNLSGRMRNLTRIGGKWATLMVPKGVVGENITLFHDWSYVPGLYIATGVSGKNFIRNLSVISRYYGNTYIWDWVDRSDAVSFSFSGYYPENYLLNFLDIEGVNDRPQARVRFFAHGLVVNRFRGSSPDYSTFDFRARSLPFPDAAVYLDWQVPAGNLIQVSGTITQIGVGEKVKVEIFRHTQEPFMGDVPEFEQEFTEAGDIVINWTPPDVGPWIVRMLAYLNQTTNPITIANLEVTGGGTGGGGGGSQNFFISEQMNVLASEALSTQVLAQVAVDSAIIGSERVEPLVQASVSDSMQASTVESVATQVFATPSESVQISAVESTATDLSVVLSESAQVQAFDAIMPELSIAASETMQVNATEATVISLPFGVSEIVQIQTEESVTVPVSIDANETTQFLSTDSVTASIDLTIVQNEEIVGDEDAQVNDLSGGVQIEVSDSVQIVANEIKSTDIVIDMNQSESIVVDESPSTQLGISVSDAMQSTLDETVTTAIQPQLSESVRVTTLEESTTDIQISAQTQTEVSATDVASATIGVAVADSEIISATEASSTTVAPSVSEVVRVTTVEQPVSQIQLSAVESVTQIETETGQFVGLVQRIMTPLGVDLDNVIGIDISIQPI